MIIKFDSQVRLTKLLTGFGVIGIYVYVFNSFCRSTRFFIFYRVEVSKLINIYILYIFFLAFLFIT